jgi:hypothetical protein
MEKKGIAVQYRPAFFSLYINDRPTISNNFGGVNQRHGHSMADESTKKLIAVSPTFLIPFLFSTRRPQHKFSPQIVQLVTGTYTDLMSFRSLNPGSQIHLVNEMNSRSVWDGTPSFDLDGASATHVTPVHSVAARCRVPDSRRGVDARGENAAIHRAILLLPSELSPAH